MESTHFRRGCWNCRSLKIGCDQDTPACQNCLQTRRNCPGYGLRLSWPRASDRRRAIVSHRRTLPIKQRLLLSRLRFLNTSTWDIDLHNHLVQKGNHSGSGNSRRLGSHSSYAIPKSMSTPWGVLGTGDQMLLSYYEGVLSRIITTVDDDRNGFRHVLIKLALSEKSISSEALLQSILAFSAYHLLQGRAGIEYSLAALKALSTSMRVATEPRDRFYQLAASMVLVTYEVFDTSESKWTIFFCGAKQISKSIFAGPRDYDGDLAFLLDWVYGHDILTKFSLLFWPQKNLCEIAFEKDPYLLSKVEDSPHRNLIIGSFGCSLELMSIISKLNETLAMNCQMELAPCDTGVLRQLEQRLGSVQQFLTTQGPSLSATSDEASILETAELFRIAALIFLERACRRRSRRVPEVEHLVESGLAILQKLKVCSVMWPLFIVACEAETDEQRMIVLASFKESRKFRKAGNISWIQGLVEAMWKQDDLFTFTSVPSAAVQILRYRSIIGTSSQLPNFT